MYYSCIVYVLYSIYLHVYKQSDNVIKIVSMKIEHVIVQYTIFFIFTIFHTKHFYKISNDKSYYLILNF